MASLHDSFKGFSSSMIITRTPFRISLFGGGTDYPTWFREHGGAVLGTAINKYCYVSVRKLPPFFDHRFRLAYSKIEYAREIEEIEHPAIRGALGELDIREGLEIHYDSDLPGRSGIGSSSSFMVGLLHALKALNGRMVSKEQLGRDAIRIEQEVLREAVGCQDQLWAAYGGFNHITFSPNGNYNVIPIVMDDARRQELRQSMMMFFTGFSRYASTIAQDKIANIPASTQQLNSIYRMVSDAIAILGDSRRPIRELGELLHASWRLKRELANSVSTQAVDEIYGAGREAGAIGGKLLGAGGGGFILFIVEPEQQERVRERLKHLVRVPIDFDRDGSKIVLYQPDKD
jgi:D-glycero-alpha-D-manno-heptose-7-phosphate kinase